MPNEFIMTPSKPFPVKFVFLVVTAASFIVIVSDQTLLSFNSEPLKCFKISILPCPGFLRNNSSADNLTAVRAFGSLDLWRIYYVQWSMQST